jgi:hypothetical protein
MAVAKRARGSMPEEMSLKDFCSVPAHTTYSVWLCFFIMMSSVKD